MFPFSHIGTGQNPQNFEMNSQMDTLKQYSTMNDMTPNSITFPPTNTMLNPYMANMMPFFNPFIASNMSMMINQLMARTMQTVNPMFMPQINSNIMMNPSSPYMMPNFHPIMISNLPMMISQPMTNTMSTLDTMKISNMGLMNNQPMTNTPSSLNTIMTPNSNIIMNQPMTPNVLNSSPIINPFLGKSTPMEWSMLIPNQTDKNNEDNTIDTTAWDTQFESKDEALRVYNEKGRIIGVVFKIKSGKEKEVDFQNNERKHKISLLCSFSLYCFEHKRGSKNYEIDDLNRKEVKSNQLKGCNSHVNFVLNKNSIIYDNQGKLIYHYNRTSYSDIHNHEIDMKRANERANRKGTAEEISKFSHDTAPKTVIKYLADNKNIKVTYHQAYYKLLKKVKKWKDKDAEKLVYDLNKGPYEYAIEFDELTNVQCVLNYIIFCTRKSQKIYPKYRDVAWVDSKYGTNKYGMRMINFSIAYGHGKNRIVLISYTRNEEKSTFKKVLQDFISFHKEKPIVLVSAYDKALNSAIDEDHPNIIHILCYWHLKQNIAKNLG